MQRLGFLWPVHAPFRPTLSLSARILLRDVVLLTLLWMLFFWRLLTPTPEDRLIFSDGDFTLHFYAFSHYQAERLADGELPLWNPYNYAGDPFAANVQFAAWYPVRWLSLSLAGPGDWTVEAYQFEVAAHYWLAALLMYAFLRALKLRPVASLGGALIFAYGGMLTGYPMLQPGILASATWLPLALLGIHLAMTRAGWTIRGSLLAGAGLALALLGGHPQTALQVMYLALAYLAYRAYTDGGQYRRALSSAAIFMAIGVGLAAVLLLPAWEFASLSYRTATEAYADRANGFAINQFMQAVWPGLFGVWSPLYVGAAGLLLALGAMIRDARRHAFWIGVIALSLLLSLGGGTILYDAFYNVVPGFNLFRQQERIALWAIFAVAVLAADQLHWLARPVRPQLRPEPLPARIEPFNLPERWRYLYRRPGSAQLSRTLAGILPQYESRLMTGQRRGDMLAEAMAAVPERQREVTRTFARIAVVYALLTGLAFAVVLVAELIRDGTAGDLSDTFGFTALMAGLFAVGLVWIVGSGGRKAVPVLVAVLVIDLFTIGSHSPNFVPDLPENRPYLAPSLAGYQVTARDILWRVDGAAGLRGRGVNFDIPDIYGTGPITLENMEHLRRIPVDRFWEALAVRYVTTGDEPPATVSLELLAYDLNDAGQQFSLFELQDPRPMAHLVYDYQMALGSPQYAREMMSAPDMNLRETGVTLEALPFDLPGARPDGAAVADFSIETPERITMTVSTPENALLTLAIPNYPGWHATIDGEPVAVYDNYAGLIGIPVAAGDNQQVVLTFMPDSLVAGAALSTLALIGAIGLAAYEFRRVRRQSAALADE